MYLNEHERAQLRDTIEQQRNAILNKAREDLADKNLAIEVGGDEVDIATQEGLITTLERLRGREVRLLRRLDETLVWMHQDDGFGYCQECHDEIGFKRLLARPTARLCIECKETQEQSERGYYHPRRRRSRSMRAQRLG